MTLENLLSRGSVKSYPSRVIDELFRSLITMCVFYSVLWVTSLLLEAYNFFSVREGYKVRSDVNITLEFRTTAVHGILLGISSAKVDAIGLEIVNSKVGCPVLAHSPHEACLKMEG